MLVIRKVKVERFSTTTVEQVVISAFFANYLFFETKETNYNDPDAFQTLIFILTDKSIKTVRFVLQSKATTEASIFYFLLFVLFSLKQPLKG